MYHAEQQTGQIFITFAVFAILIACLGLFGLVTYAAEQRTKEIGIRKVLGASVSGIVCLLSRDFTMLVGIGALIAFPVAWWAMYKWLETFANDWRIIAINHRRQTSKCRLMALKKMSDWTIEIHLYILHVST